MAFADEAVTATRLEQRQQARVAGFGPGFQLVELPEIGRFAEHGADLLEILPHRRHGGVRGAQRMLGPYLGCGQVEAGDLCSQGVDVRLGQLAALLHLAEQLALGGIRACAGRIRSPDRCRPARERFRCR